MTHDPTAEPSATTLFDPVDWESRVAEARTRRMRALAERSAAPAGPGQDATETPEATADPEARDERDFAPPAGRRSLATAPRRLALVFCAGLGLGLLLTRALPDLAPPEVPTAAATPPAPSSGSPPSVHADTPPEIAAPVPAAAAPGPDLPAAAPTPATVRPAALTVPAFATAGAEDPVAARLELPAPPAEDAAAEDAATVSALAVIRPEPRAAALRSDAAPVSPPVPEGTRIVVNAPRGLSPDTLQSVLGAMRAAGIDVGATHRVDMAVDTTNLRYFFESDRDRAAAVAASRATGAAPPALRDFTHLSPRPQPGTLELWLAGSPGGAPAATRTRTPAPPSSVDAARLRALVTAAQTAQP